jgi:hypothetical protein
MARPDGLPSLLIAVPAGSGFEHPEIGCWLFGTASELVAHRLVSRVVHHSPQSPRILMNRNGMANTAREQGFDYLLMVDPDMRPDMYCEGAIQDNEIPKIPSARKFVQTALEFLAQNPFSVIAAPACGAPPNRIVNVFRSRGEGDPSRVTHEEAEIAVKEGAIEQVTAIGSGMIMIPTVVFSVLKPPYFDDLYDDDTKSSLKMSQDVYFTNSCTECGIPVFCAWCSWAGHHKDALVGCPGIDTQWAATPKDRPVSGRTIGPDASWQPPITLARAGG